MESAFPVERAGLAAEAARLLSIPPLRRSEWATRGPDDPKFALGDLLTMIPLADIDPLAVRLDVDPDQLRIYREVALKVPAGRRVKASWTVHRDLRDRLELLRDGMTSREAAVAAGRRAFDSKADQRLTVDERAAKVWTFLADPEVYVRVEREMSRTRTERRIRYGARLVHEELARQEKDTRADLRARRNARSPLEATLKARLDLLRAAQLVHAVGELFDDLPEQSRLTEALEALREEADVILDRLNEAEPVSVIDAESWHDRTTRAAIAGSG
ncbi:hypothetical protein AB0M02_33550 [Actinoplanes sp. NPDC051861]|uniref:hypothetical protein n=1 Tax=Actinoplanes sp. NPDC051861 TaxID=3155170 RepID=UPI003417F8A8